MSEYASELRESRKASRDDSRSMQWRRAVDGARTGLPHSEIKYRVDTVMELASSLKSKSSVTVANLSALMYALSEQDENISAFFGVPGALNGLVREFTGKDANRQLLAVGCLCNLALGPSRSCISIVKSSGAYIIAYLQSQNTTLIELCCWSLGNMIANSEKASIVLRDLELHENLLHLINDDYCPNVIDSAAYALGHVIYLRSDQLSDLQMEEIASKLIKLKYRSRQIYWLLFLLSCKDASFNVFCNDEFLKNIIIYLTEIVNQNEFLYELVITNCLIRIAANICCESMLNTYSILEVIFSKEFLSAVLILMCCCHKEIQKETLWFLGNLLKRLNDSPEKQMFFESVNDKYKTVNLYL